MNRTNNIVEAWNKSFQAQVGHSNPTIWNFIDAMKQEQSLKLMEREQHILSETYPLEDGECTWSKIAESFTLSSDDEHEIIDYLELIMNL